MAKKSKLGFGAATAYSLAAQAGLAPDASDIYEYGEKAIKGAKNEIEKKLRNDKIRELLIEIGDRVIDKNIEINDKEIQDEIECIRELEERKKGILG